MRSVNKDALGERMKENYEFRARTMLPRRTHTIIRIDGKCFSSYTRGLDRPFDRQLMDDMGATTEFLAREVSGCRLAYTQSDEISLILADFDRPSTQAWFDGNQQKIVSITAAMATAKFNELRPGKLAFFDSRAFTIPDPVEVENYLIWREMDATRNSIQMAGQAHLSHKAMHGLNTGQVQERLWADHGINWNDYPDRFKRGTVVYPQVQVEPVTYVDRRTGQTCTTPAVERRVWVTAAAPRFTTDRDWLTGVLRAEPSVVAS